MNCVVPGCAFPVTGTVVVKARTDRSSRPMQMPNSDTEEVPVCAGHRARLQGTPMPTVEEVEIREPEILG